jgi:hypothetical protein
MLSSNSHLKKLLKLLFKQCMDTFYFTNRSNATWSTVPIETLSKMETGIGNLYPLKSYSEPRRMLKKVMKIRLLELKAF